MQATRKKVLLAIPGEALAVDALVAGDLALHPSWPQDADGRRWGFAITHVPSGWAIRRRMSRSVAEALFQQLASADIDWRFTVDSISPETKRAIKVIIAGVVLQHTPHSKAVN